MWQVTMIRGTVKHVDNYTTREKAEEAAALHWASKYWSEITVTAK